MFKTFKGGDFMMAIFLIITKAGLLELDLL